MSCKPVCKLCDNLVISQAVAFTGGNLEINLPAGSYKNGEKYCICVSTTPTGGSFRMIGNPCCSPDNNLLSIDGGAAPVPTA